MLVEWVIGGLVVLGAVWLVSRSARSKDESAPADPPVEGPPPRGAADWEVGHPLRIEGIVRRIDAPLEAPMSGTACAAYDLLVEHHPPPRSGGGGRLATALADALADWQEAACEIRGVPFLLEHASGVARVRADSPRLELRSADEDFVYCEDPARAFAFVDRHADTRLIRRDALRYNEWVVKEGDRVTVQGLVTDAVPAPESAGFRDAARCPVLEAPEEGPLLVELLQAPHA